MVVEHPGVVLQKYFMEPRQLTPGRLARELFLPRTRIWRIVEGLTGISADTALRLGRYFGNGGAFWQSLQIEYDVAVCEPGILSELDRIVPHRDVPVEEL